jgi:hypothetical protein
MAVPIRDCCRRRHADGLLSRVDSDRSHVRFAIARDGRRLECLACERSQKERESISQ